MRDARHGTQLSAAFLTLSCLQNQLIKSLVFPRLPAEIRTSVCRLLLAPEKDGTVYIRTESPALSSACDSTSSDHRRSRLRAVPYLIACIQAVSKQSTQVGPHLISRLRYGVSATRLIVKHAILFNSFETDIESIIPFLHDGTPLALTPIQSIQIAKRGLPYGRGFDCCEWSNACVFLATLMSLQRVTLRIVRGQPAPVLGTLERLGQNTSPRNHGT